MELRLDHIETRVNSLEKRVEVLDGDMGHVKDSMLGTLKGEPGALQLIKASLEASRHNSDKLDAMDAAYNRKFDGLSEQVNSLKMNWAKVAGALAVVAGVYKYFMK